MHVATEISGAVSIVKLSGIHVYPVKSCGPFSPKKWQINRSGLLYDRKWVIVNAAGAVLTQKREQRLCLFRPEIDLEKKLLTLRYNETSIDVSLVPTYVAETSFIKINGKLFRVSDCGREVSHWLSSVLSQPELKLMRYEDDSENGSLANDSALLMINRSSVLSIHQQMTFFDTNSTVMYF